MVLSICLPGLSPAARAQSEKAFTPASSMHAQLAAKPSPVQSNGQNIGVIELRNYVMKHGLRDTFINYFEQNFIASQEALNGHVLGRYRVKDDPDHFCWVRGFENMAARSVYLPAFYHGAFWRQHAAAANSMLANNDNVYLLKPMQLQKDSLVTTSAIKSPLLRPQKGITVVEFYTANTKLPHLLQLFAKYYLDKMNKSGFKRYSVWTSELQQNDFPQLPVFQDKNLLVVISFFSGEQDYLQATQRLAASLDVDFKTDFDDTVTLKNTWILYPTPKSIEY